MTSEWKGSVGTMASVTHQIADRFGVEAAKEYHPEVNCFTYRGWKERGFQVRKGEKAIHSITFIPMSKEIEENGEKKVKAYSVPRNVYLFYKTQVDQKV